jgi:hypothetical protein
VVEFNRWLLYDTYSPNTQIFCAGTGGGYAFGQLNPLTAQALSQYPAGANLDGSDPVLEALLLQDIETLTTDNGPGVPGQTMWPAWTTIPPYQQCVYQDTVFVGVTLSAPTLALLQSPALLPGADITDLNQNLFADAYAGMYCMPPLNPQTVLDVQAYSLGNPGTWPAFDASVVADLNAVIGGGVCIYNPARFPGFIPTNCATANGELGCLLNKPAPTPEELVRMNRLLLERGYTAELTKSALSEYVLVCAPPTATQVSAKTAWNLRVRFTGIATSPTVPVVRDFVNNGVFGDGIPVGSFLTGSDFFLRGGDIDNTHDNIIGVTDYIAFSAGWPPATGAPRAQADVDGDGNVSSTDYGLMQGNWTMSGDPDVGTP